MSTKDSHTIHVWYIYLHEWVFFNGFHVGRYTSPMDPVGFRLLSNKKNIGDPNLLIHVNGRPGGSLEKAAVRKKRSGILRKIYENHKE